MSLEINGTLRNARRVSAKEDPRGPCLSGDVYGDTKGRFRDGERVTTSTIFAETGDIFQTRYSVYRVESWADAKPANDNASLTVDQHLLVCLAEECDEVGQRVTKALRFGLDEVRPGQALTNAQRIVGEFRDLLGVAKMLHDRGVLNLDGDDSDALVNKEAKVKKYMAYAKSIGVLTGEVPA